MSRVVSCLGILLLIGAFGGGCASHRNKSFDVSIADADRALKDMRAEPKALKRPLVVLGGFCDPGIASSHLTSEFRRATGDKRVIGVSFMWCGDFDACRKEVIDAVDKAFPNSDPKWTTEVDVVGVSMGGLVGRYAAVAPPSDPEARRLRVARLFTFSTPHRGAAMATLPTLHQLQLDMRADSRFLRRLDAAESSQRKGKPYEVEPYVLLGDTIVGATNAAPEGMTPWWVPGEPLLDSHIMVMLDSRIIADVARRLRGEQPLTHGPPEPLPSDKPAEPAPAPSPKAHAAAPAPAAQASAPVASADASH